MLPCLIINGTFRAIFYWVSKYWIVLVLPYFVLWLVQKTRATFSTNQIQNWNQSRIGRPRFSRASCSLVVLLWVHHWLSKVFFFSSDWSLITLVLVFAALNRQAPYWYWSIVGNSSSLTIGTLRLSPTVSCFDQWWLTGSVHRFRTMQFSLPQEHSVWRFVYSLG